MLGVAVLSEPILMVAVLAVVSAGLIFTVRLRVASLSVSVTL